MTEKELIETFAKNIRRLRFNKGWSQAKLAETIGLSTNFISDIETGKGWVSPSTLVKLADAFEIEIKEFFTDEKHEAGEVKRIMSRLNDDILSLVNEIKDLMEKAPK
jgi:transcriptional regulator with XRE-family HTH domain